MAVTASTYIELSASMMRGLLTIRRSVEEYHQPAFTHVFAHGTQELPLHTAHALAARGLAQLELIDGTERFSLADDGRWALAELCPEYFLVTNPHADAPDGSALFVANRYGTYGRSGREWVRLGDGNLIDNDPEWHLDCPDGARIMR